MEKSVKRGSFTGSIGFVLAAAGSAVGLGNIWRFPYLAAKDGGGLFLLCYLVLALTFGFALLTTEIAIGRKTGQSPLTAYGALHRRFRWLGGIASAVPSIILPYYCVIGGWVLKYLAVFLTGGGEEAMADGYFTAFITAQWSPLIWFALFMAATAAVVYMGVDSGIERLSKILMPILLVMILSIACFSLTLSHTDESGVTRTGWEGFVVYAVPNFEGLTLRGFMVVLMDALGQLFYSISVAMGIMITYGSYVKKETNLVQSVNQIEFFDTVVAFLAGLMIVPAVYTFQGTEGMAAGPSLMFISLPRVFGAMGKVGAVVGVVFFIMVAFAALTSSVSIMEAVVSGLVDRYRMRRKKATLMVTALATLAGVVVCLGYNVFYFELHLPNDTVGQILDVMDYVSNFCLMPVVAFCTCVLIGWILKPATVIDEIKTGGSRFSREKLYVAMIRFVAPVLLVFLLLQALGIVKL